MKKVLCLILCSFLILGVTGCSSSASSNNSDTSNDMVQENDVVEETVVEKTYYCSEKDDDDWYYYFYYENDELVKVRVLAAKWSGVFEEYSAIKANAMSYEGVNLSKDSDFAYFDIDIKNGGLKYLTENFSDFGPLKTDTSWTTVRKVMDIVASECEER